MNQQLCNDCEEVIPQTRVMVFLKKGLNIETCLECQEDRESAGTYQRHRIQIQASTRCGEFDQITETLVRGG